MFATILVSPHHDDAAFSVGAMAALGMLEGPVLLVTVFSLSQFAPFLPRTRSVDEITAHRSDEDSRFASFIGATTKNLGLADAPLRFPGEELDSLISDAEADTVLVPALALQLQELVTAHCSNVLLSPMGHGRHVDHLTVRAACDAVTGCEVRYYIDQPYAGLLPRERAIGGYSRLLDLNLEEQIRHLKSKIARFYRSQPASHRMIQLLTAGGISDAIVESLWKIKIRQN